MDSVCQQLESTSIDDMHGIVSRMNVLKIKNKRKKYIVVLYGVDNSITKLKSFITKIGAANFIYNQAKLAIKKNNCRYSDKLDQLELGCPIVNRSRVDVLKFIMRNKGWDDFGIIKK